MDEVIAYLGTEPYAKLDRHLLRRFAHFGIGVSHFAVHRGIPRPGPEELRAAVAEAISIAGVLRRLGRPDSGAQRAALRRWIAEEGLATTHLLGQGHQRGKRRTKTALLRRALREVGVPEVCAECGTGPEWLGDPMTLEVDHINGDWGDDRPGNLRLLCPNCHATTSTWCRGGGRREA
ncbi:HNH endonuclease [Streptomyces echinatus]|uniref:HNH endonuclease n=1 Tax=Streptomyces echinatus TaxID=67293 RepID=UPI00382376B2